MTTDGAKILHYFHNNTTTRRWRRRFRLRTLQSRMQMNFDIVIAWTQMPFFVLLRASQIATPRESAPYRTATVRESVPCEPLLLLTRRRPWEIAPQETSHDLSNQIGRASCK